MPPVNDSNANRLTRKSWAEAALFAFVLLVCLAMIYAAVRGHIVASLVFSARNHRLFPLIERPSVILASMGAIMYAFRSLLWMRYRSAPLVDESNAPLLTVVIPAYNEGPMVAKSIDSVAAARYPKDRLQIVVVDDGSRDDTWTHIEAAAQRHPDLVEPIQFEKNQGKRAALTAGFRRARGEVVVTIDSDSVIEPDSLLAMAGAFQDPRVGAVAGKVMVFNRSGGLIPRMLGIRFLLSFDFLRAAQSAYGIVFCCPGALAGYRMSVVREVLDDWIGQRFLGVNCTYGEDRAMTNYILAKGYKSVYQNTAVVHTVVPETYQKLCKMFLRWDRSAIREDLRLVSILPKQPFFPSLIAAVEALLHNIRYPVGWVAMVLLLQLAFVDPAVWGRVMLAVGVISIFNVMYCLRDERSWRLIFGVFYSFYSMFCLFWIYPYALVSLRSRSWMTR